MLNLKKHKKIISGILLDFILQYSSGYGCHWIIRQISLINILYERILANWYIFTKTIASYSTTPPWRHICIALCNWESEKAWYILIVMAFVVYNSAVVFVGYNIWPRTPVGLWELKQTAVRFLFSCGEVTGSDVISSIRGYKWRWEIWTDSSDL